MIYPWLESSFYLFLHNRLLLKLNYSGLEWTVSACYTSAIISVSCIVFLLAERELHHCFPAVLLVLTHLSSGDEAIIPKA